MIAGAQTGRRQKRKKAQEPGAHRNEAVHRNLPAEEHIGLPKLENDFPEKSTAKIHYAYTEAVGGGSPLKRRVDRPHGLALAIPWHRGNFSTRSHGVFMHMFNYLAFLTAITWAGFILT